MNAFDRATQLPVADPELGGERFDAATIERTCCNASGSRARDPLDSVHRRVTRGDFGATP